jgi:hypothetical protein
LRPSFLDDVSTTEAGSCASSGRRHSAGRAKARRRTGVISHKMSRHYWLEYPVDDPDEDDDDDTDEDDEDGDDEDSDEEEPETWQVSDLRRFL